MKSRPKFASFANFGLRPVFCILYTTASFHFGACVASGEGGEPNAAGGVFQRSPLQRLRPSEKAAKAGRQAVGGPIAIFQTKFEAPRPSVHLPTSDRTHTVPSPFFAFSPRFCSILILKVRLLLLSAEKRAQPPLTKSTISRSPFFFFVGGRSLACVCVWR